MVRSSLIGSLVGRWALAEIYTPNAKLPEPDSDTARTPPAHQHQKKNQTYSNLTPTVYVCLDNRPQKTPRFFHPLSRPRFFREEIGLFREKRCPHSLHGRRCCVAGHAASDEAVGPRWQLRLVVQAALMPPEAPLGRRDGRIVGCSLVSLCCARRWFNT